MSLVDAEPVTAPQASAGCVVPMFVCAGCRPEALGYASIEYGDRLDEMITCPMRDVCTWHAGHDLGGICQYNEQPDAALLTPLFRTEPYFACPNFHDYAAFIAGGKVGRIRPRQPDDQTAARTSAATTSA